MIHKLKQQSYNCRSRKTTICLERFLVIKKIEKYLDDVDVAGDLPLGQPIEINGMYFMKVLSNGRSIDST